MSNQKTNLTKKRSSIKKTILQYSAIFEPAQEEGYNVLFPQFPGCVTFGRTFEESKIKAKEVLELWIEELVFSIGTLFAIIKQSKLSKKQFE
ncbi:type II toxin-antitoxin system HicB family antitoxin [Patescibacteria group bacterium]|nr:type II toxin-antitoxin system HicB family antitoxin [Patescibacteria group bacterium]